MDELIGIKWGVEQGFQHAFDELQDMPDHEFRRRGCTRKCAQATDNHSPGFPSSTPRGPFTVCSGTCLESLLPPAWKDFWNRNIPDSIKTDVKPMHYFHMSQYEFFHDSVVYTADSSMGVCSKWDETVFGKWYSTELNKRHRITYRSWKIRNDSIYLREGMNHSTTSYPYKSFDAFKQASNPVQEKSGEFRLKSQEFSRREITTKQKVLQIFGLTLYEPILIGL